MDQEENLIVCQKVEQFIVVVAQMNCISHSVQLEKLDSLLCGGTNKLY